MSETRRVLVVEDSAADAAATARCLRQSQTPRFEVCVAGTLAHAISMLEARFDAVLLEVDLPDSDAYATLPRLQAAAPGAPVVIVTHSEDQLLARRCIHAGASAYLLKERSGPEALCAAVRGTIEHHESVAAAAS